MVTHRSRRNLAIRSLLAAALALTLVGGVTLLWSPTAVHAFPVTGHVATFTSPTGEDWIVPDKVTTMLVGMRGGAGGCVRCSTPGGFGKSSLLQVPVTPGDTLTVYSGQPGKSFGRTAGKGFVNGGNGGGGASALKINGELIAVAGGGGGGGGAGGAG